VAARVENLKENKSYRFFLSVDDKDIRKMLVQRGHKIELIRENEWDIALFPGGPDIAPMLYGENLMPCTGINWKRDLQEIQFYKSLSKNRMKVGICRGAQLLNVMSGGRMWQHVNNHVDDTGKGHVVHLWGIKESFRMTSTHHQMMIPSGDAWVIGSAAESTIFENETIGRWDWTDGSTKNEFGR
jgi:gamma-glutamyl-gamma-aminobutyrate hydrolase PuuD